jgi:hypothetical protein
MYKYLSIMFLTLTLVGCDPTSVQRAIDLLNTTGTSGQFSVADGLKQALDFGVDSSVKQLSAQGGYLNGIYKILLPEEAQKVINVVSKVPGFQNVEANIIKKINTAAEDAATKAGPIFVNAITSITFDDAMNILKGNNNAATTYLDGKTHTALYREFQPVIVNSLNKVGALDLYSDVVTKYNTLPLVEKKNPDISDFITERALDGLFGLIAKKEEGIRTDINQRTTDLLRNVFAQQD